MVPVREQPVCDQEQDFGPVLQFGGVTGRWTGSTHSNRTNVGIEARVNFEAHASERTMSFLEIGNGGTTALYFNWKVQFSAHAIWKYLFVCCKICRSIGILSCRLC